MKRLKGLILLFLAMLTIPLIYFVFQSYRSFQQEEAAQLRYFAETLMDDMEQALADLIRREEGRPVDAYNSYYVPQGEGRAKMPSPLSRVPEESYILGYFQNNPDGSFQTPLIAAEGVPPMHENAIDIRLRRVNRIFNERLAAGDHFREPYQAPPPSGPPGKPAPSFDSFAARYLKRSAAKEQKMHLGQKGKQVRELTVDQAVNLARKDRLAGNRAETVPDASFQEMNPGVPSLAPSTESTDTLKDLLRKAPPVGNSAAALPPMGQEETTVPEKFEAVTVQDAGAIRAEIDPMQSVFIDPDLVLIYRRIALNNRIFRQGFVLQLPSFFKHLLETRFSHEPISRFTRLTLLAEDNLGNRFEQSGGAVGTTPKFSMTRRFPRPFSFLTATLTCRDLPRSSGRSTLIIMIGILAGVVLAGFVAIYRSVHALVDLSERRSKFVSSVTHELKTPLTNIRMYIEMLEQGIARSPEREQEYFRILGTESSRLARLINHILEFSKLEKKELRLNLQFGSLDEVISESCGIMAEALKKAGFTVDIRLGSVPTVAFDREMLIQVLVNLVENSIKFGRQHETRRIIIHLHREGRWVRIDVSDTGPGIPRQDLKRVFDDFYRAENALIRSTRGTGIGLAFVRKVMVAMKGRVSAANNDGPGCTVTLWLPTGEK